jgi:hypothetical protein
MAEGEELGSNLLQVDQRKLPDSLVVRSGGDRSRRLRKNDVWLSSRRRFGWRRPPRRFLILNLQELVPKIYSLDSAKAKNGWQNSTTLAMQVRAFYKRSRHDRIARRISDKGCKAGVLASLKKTSATTAI